MNKEKQEIKKIASGIDIMMFGKKYKRNLEEDWESSMTLAAMGAIFGCGISFSADYTDSKMLIPPLIFTLVGIGTGCLSNIKNKKNIYKKYEAAYLNLSRKEQIEVLKLSKKMFELYKKELQTNGNKKRIDKYLQISDGGTMFDEFEFNHPQLKLLTKERINAIHAKGKLTPIEKFNEWKELNYCPANDGYNFRCDNYETCRDCAVAWANEKDEWDKMKTIPIEAVYSLKDDYEQLNFKKKKEYVKTNKA